jgi:hypothetical protein
MEVKLKKYEFQPLVVVRWFSQHHLILPQRTVEQIDEHLGCNSGGRISTVQWR